MSRKLILTLCFSFIGLILAISSHQRWLESFEQTTLKWRFQEASHVGEQPKPHPDVVILNISETCINRFIYRDDSEPFAWPWPRDFYAYLVRYLSLVGARDIVFDLILAPGVRGDKSFAKSIKGSHTPVHLALLMARYQQEIPDSRIDKAVTYLAPTGRKPQVVLPQPKYKGIIIPNLEFLKAGAKGGFVNLPSVEYDIRLHMTPWLKFRDRSYPAMVLNPFAGGKEKPTVKFDHNYLQIGDKHYPLDRGRYLINYYGPPRTFPYFQAAPAIETASAYFDGDEKTDEWEEKIEELEDEEPDTPAAKAKAKKQIQQLSQKIRLHKEKLLEYGRSKFGGKIVIIGSNAVALGDHHPSPYSINHPGVEIQATLVSNFLSQHSIHRRDHWSIALILILPCLLFLAIIAMRGFWGSLLLWSGISGGYILLNLYLFSHHRQWLDLVNLELALLLAMIAGTMTNYILVGRQKRWVKRVFSHYLSPSVVKEALANPDKLGLGGERRVLTAFFSDIAGFTALAENMEPEELVHLLNRYLGRMSHVIIDRGGTLDKYEGDAIMAFWGAPMDMEDHAYQACLAGLECYQVLLELNQELGIELDIRIGLNTGEMVVGNMGSDIRFDYTIIGDAVNLAARLEGVNKMYQTNIIISEFTWAQVDGKLVARELDQVCVKGKKEAVRIYQPLGKVEEVSTETLEMADLYHQGLENYRQQDFAAAIAHWEEVLQHWPNDGPSQVMIERARQYMESPPADDWDGAHILTSK